jgi:hypothetical protein
VSVCRSENHSQRTFQCTHPRARAHTHAHTHKARAQRAHAKAQGPKSPTNSSGNKNNDRDDEDSDEDGDADGGDVVDDTKLSEEDMEKMATMSGLTVAALKKQSDKDLRKLWKKIKAVQTAVRVRCVTPCVAQGVALVW